MPIYEYRCADCGFQDEFLQKLSEPHLTDCPSCGKSTLRKQLTAAGFQLKGSGWYATDFKNSGKSGSSAGGKSDAKDGAKSDVTTDATSGSKSEAGMASGSASKPGADAGSAGKSATSAPTT
ncbi:MAG TPA: zinc ribbon domain-containing protein [Burkholderiales bacterium]